MMSRTIRTTLLAIAIGVLAAPVAYADPVTLNGGEAEIPPSAFTTIVLGTAGPQTFVFQNPFAFFQATDFHVVAVNVVMFAASGGEAFPNTQIPPFCVAAGGGFTCVTFDGGDGLTPGDPYIFSFLGFPDGATFLVTFSAVIDGKTEFAPPATPTPGTPSFPRDGFAAGVPEPATLLLLGTGLAGLALRTQKRLKGRKEPSRK